MSSSSTIHHYAETIAVYEWLFQMREQELDMVIRANRLPKGGSRNNKIERIKQYMQKCDMCSVKPK